MWLVHELVQCVQSNLWVSRLGRDNSLSGRCGEPYSPQPLYRFWAQYYCTTDVKQLCSCSTCDRLSGKTRPQRPTCDYENYSHTLRPIHVIRRNGATRKARFRSSVPLRASYVDLSPTSQDRRSVPCSTATMSTTQVFLDMSRNVREKPTYEA